jgi:uncharacterized oxidoreductase
MVLVMHLTDNTIFIPGATSGIGLALAIRLQARGNTVIIGGRRAALLSQLRAEHGFHTVTIDTADAASIRSAATEVITAHPDLNTLVAMAGIMAPEDWHDATGFLDSAESIVTTNLLGPIRLIAAFIEQLRSRPHASLITVSSGLAHVPLGMTPSYNASKAAIHMLSESIRLQLADTAVQVIELAPPAVQTDLLDVETPGAMGLDDYADEVLALLEAEPAAHEILVENVKFLRDAEVRGVYDQVVGMLNAA